MRFVALFLFFVLFVFASPLNALHVEVDVTVNQKAHHEGHHEEPLRDQLNLIQPEITHEVIQPIVPVAPEVSPVIPLIPIAPIEPIAPVEPIVPPVAPIVEPISPIVPIPPIEEHPVDPVIAVEPLHKAEAQSALSSSSASSFEAIMNKLAHNTHGWPVANQPVPKEGAILPYRRIISYYGNFYSKQMGVLGQYPEDQVVSMLQKVVKEWEAADPEIKPIPCIELIATSAQGSPGKDGMYRLRMPSSQVEKALEYAKKVGPETIVMLDIQSGLSHSEVEVPIFEEFLKLPNVHLALDPEFSMKASGKPPGHVVGTMDAEEINNISEYLHNLVVKHNLPPKVLVVHRWTAAMVTNADKIKLHDDVQIVIDMDGWGSPARKTGTYNAFVAAHPVQMTGIKLFYKNDLKPPSKGLMTIEEVLDLHPKPSFVQYQ